MSAIAVIGLSFQLPQNSVDDSTFWNVLENGENLMTEWPATRAATESFYKSSPDSQNAMNTLRGRGAHFLGQDPTAFDAPFFAITAKEAAAMDPQQRLVLETAYHAFENAGITLKDLNGSQTGVFGASMSDDFARILAKDPDVVPRTAATGVEPSTMPNRVSWYFNLRGPSVQINTACSSSMIALDMACQSIQNGDSSMALVFGSSLLLSPEVSILLSNMGFLSADSLCYSFDHRANGYSRGEGVVAIVIRPVVDAVEHGDVLRAVIRATCANQDGRTPTLTQPSAEAQEALIRRVYEKAGLSPKHTRYLEAHGTGTPTGDPIEMKAIGRVFRTHRTTEQPLYVGSVKSNIGHLEGGSGLAGLIKSILSLEKGVIPPNALFEKMNPKIDAAFYNVSVPTQKIPWPSGEVRRASVNSFGFGGSNAHVILDDALHYLQSRGISGYHNCTILPDASGRQTINGTTYSSSLYPANIKFSSPSNSESNFSSPLDSTSAQLLVWSAVDSNAIDRVINQHTDYLNAKVLHRPEKLEQYAYTLAERRNHMSWRSYAVLQQRSHSSDEFTLLPSKPMKQSAEVPLIAFVFTGQGAQYVDMGRKLTGYTVFANALQQADDIFSSFGAKWSLFNVLGDIEKINSPEYSQPLCTALQLALIALLQQSNVNARAVVGHSSGEIAAAYAVGALSFISACKVAYCRGIVAEKLRKDRASNPDAMISVNLSETQIIDYIEQKTSIKSELVNISCINSPNNCTLSGPLTVMVQLKSYLEKDEIFAQMVNTGLAYHSPVMVDVSQEYQSLLDGLESAKSDDNIPAKRAVFISSVTGRPVAPKLLCTAKYWVDNLISPVRFVDALKLLDSSSTLSVGLGSNVTDIVEVGPHSALRRPILDTVQRKVAYHTMLQRSKDPSTTVLAFFGSLFCSGYPVNVSMANGFGRGRERRQPPPLVDLPPYPFDHSRKYWSESRISKSFRLRPQTNGHLLGKPSNDFNNLRPSYRNWLSVETKPWLGDHVISNTAICPGTGMIVMTLEAIRLCASPERLLSGFLIEEAQFLSPIQVSEDHHDATETALYLSPLKKPHEKDTTRFEVSIHTFKSDEWTEAFKATIKIQYQQMSPEATPVDHGADEAAEAARIHSLVEESARSCNYAVESKQFYEYFQERGLAYGPAFRLLENLRWDGRNTSVANISMDGSHHWAEGSPVHPAVLDAAVHLTLTQVSDGITSPTPTLVPQLIRNAWISAKAWVAKEQTSSISVATLVKVKNELVVESSLYAIDKDNQPLCSIEHIAMMSVSSSEKSESQAFDKSRRLLYNIEWRPQLSLMSSQELCHYCCNQHTREESYVDFPTLDLALRKAARLALHDFKKSRFEVASLPLHIQKFINSLEFHYGNMDIPSDLDVSKSLENCEKQDPTWALCVQVAKDLPNILRGKSDTLELLFASDGPEKFYAQVFNDICDERISAFIDLISHEKPDLRILEVGAGTGSMTSHILEALGRREQQTGSARFIEYVYTDISPVFFEAARSKFAAFNDRIFFKKLDLECSSLIDEGFELASFDLVVAGSVLHATADLASTLTHLRGLLKSGGHLLMLEIVAEDCAWANVGFGGLPGWWMSREEWRVHGPLISEASWDLVTRNTGFSGLDLVVRNSSGISLLVTTASPCPTEPSSLMESRIPSDHAKPILSDANLVILVDLNSLTHKTLATVLLQKYPRAKILANSDQLMESRDQVILSLLEVGNTSWISSLTETEFVMLKKIMNSSNSIFWISGLQDIIDDKYIAAKDPYSGTTTGFLRVLRAEEPAKHIVSLVFESDASELSLLSKRDPSYFILKILDTCFFQQAPPNTRDFEYAVKDGYLSIGRLSHQNTLDSNRENQLAPSIKHQAWQPGPPLALAVRTAGMLDSLCYMDDTKYYSSDLGQDQVEIEAKVWPVSFRDIFVALGRLIGEDFGFECAGVVTRVGKSAKFDIGDRVCMIQPGCMRMYPRASSDLVFKLPDSLSFEDAIAGLNPGMTAYQALVNAARLQKEEKILIHSAAGSTGQMAVGIAQNIGAEVFVTVSSDEKKSLIMDLFGIPADHIFYSRDTSFARGIKRVTNGRGVDVVLNSLSGDALRASWECIAPYGRFIEIGKMDIGSNSSLPMASFAKNVSFMAIDLHHIAQDNSRLTRQLVNAVMDFIVANKARRPHPLHFYSLADVEAAFRYMQSGRNTGRIILTMDKDVIIPKFITQQSVWVLDSNASYLVAGGFGGLGREIVRWLASKRAKYIVIPSRSGPSSKSAGELVAELQSVGVQVMAPRCDISSETDMSDLIHSISASEFPRIKGCINSAMVLQDSVFDGMTHAQWKLAVDSKVKASWNLHTQLPDDMDFFILLSSLSGIYGSLAQSNYAAGCTFQDSLARYRTAQGHGKTSVSLDIGWMHDIGIIAETEAYKPTRANAGDMNPVFSGDLIATLDYFCDPGLEAFHPGVAGQDQSQLLLGAVTPVDMFQRGETAIFAKLPFLSPFAASVSLMEKQPFGAGYQRSREESPAVLFQLSTTDAERVATVISSLMKKLSRALTVSEEDIDSRKPLSDYGVDSLMAVELRNWIRRDFSATVAVFDIMAGSSSIDAIGILVVDRWRKENA